MKFAAAFAALGLASCAAVPTGPAQVPSAPLENRFSLYLGQRSLDEDDWEPVDEQVTLGLEYSQERAGSALGWEVGLMGSRNEDDEGAVDFEARTGEVYGGIRKSFGDGTVRPYVGGGLAFIHAEVDVSPGGDDDDGSIAGYGHGGVSIAVSDTFNVGLDLRVLFGSDLEIAGEDIDADYGQLALFIAIGF